MGNKKKKSNKKPQQVVETAKEPEIQKVEDQEARPVEEKIAEPSVSSPIEEKKISMSEIASELNNLDIKKEKA